MRIQVATILVLLHVAPGPSVQAAFECLPGPAKGGLSDWVCEDEGAAPGFGVTGAFGRPAAIQDLGWSWVELRAGAGRVGLHGSLYLLRFDDVYSETAAGLGLECHDVTMSLRRWEVRWGDDDRRDGWVADAETRARWKRTFVRLAAQGLCIGTSERAAPPLRVSIDGDQHLGGGLHAGAAAFRSRDGAGWIGRVVFAPVSAVRLQQQVVWPGNTLRSGIEMWVGKIGTGLWYEPSTALGARLGVRCCVR